MNKSTILPVFFLVVLLSNCMTPQKSLDSAVVEQDGKPTQAVVKLLELTGVQHDGTLSDVVQKTQDQWLRKPNQERWDMEKYASENEYEIRQQFDSLGMNKGLIPKYQEYDYAIILGALFGRITLRLQYAIDLWQQGIRFKRLVFLGGARPVVESQGENKQKFMEFFGLDSLDDEAVPKTEAEIMKFVYQYTAMPEEMRSLPVTFINASMVQQDDGSLKRPTTDDIIADWLQTKPSVGKCLFFSNQPYVGFQHAVVKTYMPRSFQVETIGTEANPTLNVGVVLDNVARWLYQEHKRLQQH